MNGIETRIKYPRTHRIPWSDTTDVNAIIKYLFIKIIG